MKTILKLMLALMLCVSLTGAALAAPGDATLFDNTAGEYEYVQSMTAYQNALYLLTGKGLYRYDPSTGTNELLAGIGAATGAEDDDGALTLSEEGNGVLIAGDDALYLLDTGSGALSRLSFNSGALKIEPIVKLDWTDMMMPMQSYSMARAGNRGLLIGNHLYVSRMEDDYISYKLMRFDVETGKGQRISEETVTSFTSYKDGELLALTRKSWDTPMTINRLNPETGALTEVMASKGEYDFGLQYDAASDTIYFMSAGQLYASRAGAPGEIVAYLPVASSWESFPTVLLEGYYALSDYNQVSIRNIDPAYKPDRALKVNGLYSDEISRAFGNEHPEVPLVMATTHYGSAEELTQNMLSGDTASDLYVLYLSYSQYESLVSKGYAADLSGSEKLKQAVERMYPEVREILEKDGKLFAVPQYLDAYAMGYSPKVLETIGLTEDDLPKTYAEFLDFLDRWEREIAPGYPDLTLFENQADMDLRSQLFSSIFQDYMLLKQRSLEDLSFDTELFKQLLTKIEETDFSSFRQVDPNDEAYAESGGVMVSVSVFGGEEEGPKALFNTYRNATLTGYRYDDGYELLPLALDENLTPILKGEMSIFIVNPNSENQDLAIQFLEYYMENLNAAIKVNLMPGETEAVLNPDFDDMKKNIEELVKESRAAYEAAVGTENEKAMELELQTMERGLAQMEQFRYSVTEEDIAEYRALYPMLVINKGNVFYDGGGEQSQELATLTQRYLDKQMQPEQFVKELDKKIRMMMMEGN